MSTLSLSAGYPKSLGHTWHLVSSSSDPSGQWMCPSHSKLWWMQVSGSSQNFIIFEVQASEIRLQTRWEWSLQIADTKSQIISNFWNISCLPRYQWEGVNCMKYNCTYCDWLTRFIEITIAQQKNCVCSNLKKYAVHM